jgi:hypothetical protein
MKLNSIRHAGVWAAVLGAVLCRTGKRSGCPGTRQDDGAVVDRPPA